MEYERGPWIDIPEGGMCEREIRNGEPFFAYGKRIRILTPKPKREFIVGKWYKTVGNEPSQYSPNWVKCIGVDGDMGWVAKSDLHYATRVNTSYVDWSVDPRNEAP